MSNTAVIKINRGEELPLPKMSKFVTKALKQLQELERIEKAYLQAELAWEAEKALLTLIVGAIVVMIASNIKIRSLINARQRTSWQISGRGKVTHD